MVKCSACNTNGHTKRSKICPFYQHQNSNTNPMPNEIQIKQHKKPVIIHDPSISMYYSIVDETDFHFNGKVVLLCFKNGTARWCYTSGDNKYHLCPYNSNRPDNAAIQYTIKVALWIPKPTNAQLSILLWEFIYIPNIIYDVSLTHRDCPVCFETFHSNNLIKFNCNHYFCIDCVQGYVRTIQSTDQTPGCPMCREKITHVSMSQPNIYNDLSNTVCKL
jgi:hypothetical protein